MLTLNDGRNELWQWDTGRKLTVGTECSQVHFSNKILGRSIDVNVIDGIAVIPDFLLQTDKELMVWAFVGTPENGYTKISNVFKVNRRNKPADYVFTPPEQTTLAEIMERIDDLEAIQDPDAIKNAVDDYLANNPIKVVETDPTVPEWAKQPNPPDVKIPDKLPNPHTLTFTGVVNASYDGSSAVEIKIPDSGGNVEQIEPMADDIPKVFFSGDTSGMTKDNEKVLQFAYKSRTSNFGGYVKMKWQGSSTLAFPKKNFTIKMFTDEACESKLKKAFKDWGYEKNKYVLKADYIDHTHARNIVTANLWSEMVECRPDFASLPDGMKNAPGHGAIDGFPIKLYLNGAYQGIYTWTIGKEDWMFGMDEDNANHAVICAEKNNNGNTSTTDRNILACEFRENANIDGNDWDLEFPETLNNSIKVSFNNLINCVKDTDDESFKATIENYLDVMSALDYYILAYLSANCDGLGKNLIMMTYDGVKWFCSAYDMDNIWGSRGTNTFVGATYACPEEYYDNNSLLWKRIESCFGVELYARYKEVRKKVLSFENVIDKFERFCDLIGTELYAEDVEIYSGIPYPTQNNLKQIRNFFTPRAEYVDACFAEIGNGESGGNSGGDGSVPCTGISLSASTLTFAEEGTQTLIATVTPDNCTDAVKWTSSNTDVARVADGTVTAVGNGNAVITATCGNYSATCTVSVAIEIPEPSYTYQMTEPTTFASTADIVNTGVKLLETDRDWSIALDMTPNAQSGESCVFVINGQLKFLTHSRFNNGYGFWSSGEWVATDIPMGVTVGTKLVLTHTRSSGVATAHYYMYGEHRTCNIKVGTGDGELYIGADDGWSTPVRPWTGVMNAFEILDRPMTDAEINDFIGGSTLLYQLAEATTFASTADMVNTGVAPFEKDSNWTIALDMTPNAQSGESCVLVVKSTLKFSCHPTIFGESNVYGFLTNNNGIKTSAGIPMSTADRIKMTIVHVEGSGVATAHYSINGVNKSVEFAMGTGSGVLYIGADDGWSTPVRPWSGTMHSFEVHYKAFADDEVDSFLNS